MRISGKIYNKMPASPLENQEEKKTRKVYPWIRAQKLSERQKNTPKINRRKQEGSVHSRQETATTLCLLCTKNFHASTFIIKLSQASEWTQKQRKSLTKYDYHIEILADHLEKEKKVNYEFISIGLDRFFSVRLFLIRFLISMDGHFPGWKGYCFYWW